MNQIRRNQIKETVHLITGLKALLERISNMEGDFYNGMPEGVQDSDVGDSSLRAIGYLADAIGYLEDVEVALNEAME